MTPEELRAASLANLERLAQEEPLYAVKAFLEDYPPGEPLPLWVDASLRELLQPLLDAIEHGHELPAGKVTARMAQLLGLTSRGRTNRVEQYRQNQRNAHVAFMREGRRSPSISAFARAYGVTRGAVKDWIRRAHELWGKQVR
jgi:DNA-binding transcriptional regulator YiaG